MMNCKTVSIPINTSKKLCSNDGTLKRNELSFRRIVGSIIPLTYIRPHIMFYVDMLRRFMHFTSSHHFGGAKRILCETMDLRIHYHKVQDFNLVGYSDGELSQHKNTRVPSEPRYELRKRTHSQQKK